MLKFDFERIVNNREFTQELECPIDLLCPVNPIMCSKCNQVFCEDCITTLTKCPLCNNVDVQFVSTKNTMIEYELSKIRIKCENIGCKMHFKLDSIEHHQEQCIFNTFNCDYCHAQIRKIDKTSHLLNNCQAHKALCIICGMDEDCIVPLASHINHCLKEHELCSKCFSYHKLNIIQCKMNITLCNICNTPDLVINFENFEHNCIESKIMKDPLAQEIYFTLIIKKIEASYNNNLQTNEERAIKIIKLIKKIKNDCWSSLSFQEQYLNQLLKNKNIEIEREERDILEYMSNKNEERKNENNKISIEILYNQELVSNLHTQVECLKETINKEYDMIVYNFLDSICKFNHIAQTQSVSNNNDLNSNLIIIDDYDKFASYVEVESNSNINNKEISNINHINNDNKEIIAQKNNISNICKGCNSDKIISNNCSICKNNFCLNCCTKCFSDHCSLYYCNNCFSINKHQVRSSNLDCHFSRCKDCDKKGFCLMMSINCIKCSKRVCSDCYFLNHKIHYDVFG